MYAKGSSAICYMQYKLNRFMLMKHKKKQNK